MVYQPEAIALWLSIEDYSGLWEVVWDIRTQHPQKSPDAALDDARTAVEVLLHRGWIELYLCRDLLVDELEVLSAEEVSAALADPIAWQPPEPGALSFQVAATALGEREYWAHRCAPASGPA